MFVNGVLRRPPIAHRAREKYSDLPDSRSGDQRIRQFHAVPVREVVRMFAPSSRVASDLHERIPYSPGKKVSEGSENDFTDEFLLDTRLFFV